MKYVLPFLLCVVIAACGGGNNPSTVDTGADSTVGAKPTGFAVAQLAGVFYDTLPCADCPGIATKVYLKPDQTFVMERDYVGKNVAYETGTWAISDSLLHLTGTSSPQQFKIESYALLDVLDTDGKEITGAPKKMELHRNNVPFKPQKPVPVEGIFKSSNDTMAIHICSMNKDYQATLAPTAMMMSAKYKQTAKQQGQSLFAKVAGHFELRPSLNDTTTQDFFVIEKFISFDPKGACK